MERVEDEQKYELSSIKSAQSDDDIEENDSFEETESSIEFQDKDGDDKDDLAAATGASKKMTYVETARMFKLRRNLDQLDRFRRQKECDIFEAREELKLLQQNLIYLLTQKESLEKKIETAGESSVALFRLRARHENTCRELRDGEEMKARIDAALRQRELDLSELEVELGRFSSIQQELLEDERAFQHLKTRKAEKRMRQERKAGLQLKMRHLKNQRPVLDTDVSQEKEDEERANRKTAVKFLKETLRRMQQDEAEKQQQKITMIEKRINAVKSLKSSIAATHENVRVHQSRAIRVNTPKKEQQEPLQARSFHHDDSIRRQKQLERRQKQEESERQGSERVEVATRKLPEQKPTREESGRREGVETPGRLETTRVREKLRSSVSSIQHREWSESSSSSDSSDLEDLEEALGPGVEGCLARPEFPGLWEQKYKTPSYQKLTPIPVTQDEVPATAKLHLSSKNTLGSKLKGPSFVSKPELVSFTDFEVKETYTKRIILTNSSSMTNNCRFLGVSSQIKEFITISFKTPGPLSSGMSCDFTLMFQPQLNKDMEGEIMFASAAGSFSVPVRCTTKKCQVQVSSHTVDFGPQLVGQNVSQTITLSNKGALATSFQLDTTPRIIPETRHAQMSVQALASNLMDSNPDVDQPKQDSSEASVENKAAAVDPQAEESPVDSCDIHLGDIKEGTIGAFETIRLDVYFSPSIPGENRLDFKIVFSDPNTGPIPIKVTGSAITLPVCVVQPSMDLKICTFDHLYQDRIQVLSRASAPLRLTFEVSQEMRRHLEIRPKTGVIQAQSHFNVHLKFLPRLSLLEDAGKYFDKNTGVLEVPVMIQVENQVKPIQVTVQAVVTTSDIRFELDKVDFGVCSLHQSVRSSVRLTNLSLLSQEFGFVGLPEFIDVQPNDGFGTILPQETLEIDLIFSAEKQKEYNFQLTCKTATNREFHLSCRAVGVRPPLELSHSLVQFGATALGDKSTALLHLSNQRSDKSKPSDEVAARLFSFVPPSDSPVTITPSSGRLLPGQRCLLQVTFSPRLQDQDIQEEALKLIQRELLLQDHEIDNKYSEGKDIQEVKTRGKKLSASSKTSKVSDRTDSEPDPENPDLQPGSRLFEEARLSLLKSFKRFVNKYMVPCFVSDGDTPVQNRQDQPEYSLSNTLYLELLCPVVQPPLVVVSSKRHNCLDFQHVAVGERVLQSLTIQNISDDTVEIWSSLLDLSGPFTQLKTLREMKPGQKQTLNFAFSPASAKKYCEVLEVRCSKMALGVTLKGEGVIHKVSWSHPGELLDFGYVMERDSVSQVISLQNSASFAVDFMMILSGLVPSELQGGFEGLLGNLIEPIMGTRNFNGSRAFTVTPMLGTIEAGKSQDVTVTFQPDRASPHYSERLTVQTSNKSQLCAMDLKGAASTYNVFVRGGERLTLPLPSLVPPELTFTRLQLEEFEEAEKSCIPVLLLLQAVCTAERVQPAVQELQVGCIKPTKYNKKGADFFMEGVEFLMERGFTVEPSRGSVAPGESSTITITWSPPSEYKPGETVEVLLPLTVTGDETLVYDVTLMAQVSLQ